MNRLYKLSGLVVLMFIVNLSTVLVMTKWDARAGDTEDCVVGDLNGDGRASIIDAVYYLEWMFEDGDPPVACAEGPGLSDQEIELLQDLAQYVSVIDVEDPNDEEVSYKTIRFEEVNVQIVNGLGATNGNPDSPHHGKDTEVNGVGNRALDHVGVPLYGSL